MNRRSIIYFTLIVLAPIGFYFFVNNISNSNNQLKDQIKQFDKEYRKDKEERERERKEGKYDKPDGYATFFNRIKTKPGKEESLYKTNYLYYELLKAKNRLSDEPKLKSAKAPVNWVQRGPGNVGGRTRCILVDPDDSTGNTWFAGSVSGGIWKTTDAGESWTNLTTEIANLATTTLAMAPSNHNIIYAGTGEGYGGFGMVMGNGIFVSSDKGENWILADSTFRDDDYRYVNKLWVSPENELIVLAATNKGIWRSSDGCSSWDSIYYKGYAVQDLVQNPENENTLYAAVNRLGIIKSTNGGISWNDSFNGIGAGKRFSVAVSPVDTSYIFSAAEVSASSMDIYISTDAGATWLKHNDAVGSMINFHGVQGWFNNVIEPHPYDKNKLFVGGVYLGMVEFQTNTFYGDNEIIRVDTVGTGSYMGFVNFGGSFLGGGMMSGLEEGAEVEREDFTSIKIYFGPGRSQKAYRFVVPEGEGSGVPQNYYYYCDYVDVPFEVWDITNNRQLMVSFRDQERDSVFNLIEREFDNDTLGREYLFVHAIEYSETPNEDIAQDGGHFEKMIYFFWPTLDEDKIWNPQDIPESIIEVTYGAFRYRDLYSYTISDDRKNDNLHVDHHDIHIIPVNETEDLFTIIDANDGGVAVSYNSGDTWEMMTNGYITTQFYGIAKKSGAHEYIGGMQDNGTWQSPWNETADKTSEYELRVEGDGFESLWHPWYPKRIIGSSYYNYIKLSMDGGETWEWITDGLGSDGPFITRLSHSVEAPNVIYTVGNNGVYRHVNFGTGRYPWQLIELDEGWTVSSSSESSHLVEVSLANPDVVWAGEGMYEEPDLHIFVSKDQGVSFEATINYDKEKMGYLSGLATHPDNDSIAYALFSMKGEPKILRTSDFGNIWEDISGFGLDSSSSNGFPDVAVFSLMVMPGKTNTIWAGTEIGIFESIDNGTNWHYADNGLPAVSVWQMKVVDNTVIVATHGRGIWTANISSFRTSTFEETSINLTIYPNPAREYITVASEGFEIVNGEYFIYNIKGQLKQKGQLNSSEEYITLNNITSGTYIIRIESNGKIIEKKFLVSDF